jgi:hypothetical protein
MRHIPFGFMNKSEPATPSPGYAYFSIDAGVIVNDINVQSDDSVLISAQAFFDGAAHLDSNGGVIAALIRDTGSGGYVPINDTTSTIEKFSSTRYIVGDGTTWTNLSGGCVGVPYTALLTTGFTYTGASFSLNANPAVIRNSNNALGFIAVGGITNGVYSSNYGSSPVNLNTGYDLSFQSTGKLLEKENTPLIQFKNTIGPALTISSDIVPKLIYISPDGSFVLSKRGSVAAS